MHAAIIEHGVPHQMSHKVLGHYVIHNVTKFQHCRPHKYLFIAEKSSQKYFQKNNSLV